MKNNMNICQICLHMDRPLKVVDRRLSEFHDELCEFNLHTIDPKYCPECEHLLRKMYAFRAKCQKSNEILRSWQKKKMSEQEPLSKLYTHLPKTVGRWTSHNNLICSFVEEEPSPAASVTLLNEVKIEFECDDNPDKQDVVTLSSDDSDNTNKSVDDNVNNTEDTIKPNPNKSNNDNSNSSENNRKSLEHESPMWNSFISELTRISDDGLKIRKPVMTDDDSDGEAICKDSSTQTESKMNIAKRKKNDLSTDLLNRNDAGKDYITTNENIVNESHNENHVNKYERISADIDNVSESETNVGNSMTNFGDGKTNVGDGKTNVRNSKTNVGDNKTNVADSKTNVPDSKTNIADSKRNVKNSKTNFGNSKTNDEDSKTNVADSKTNEVSIQKNNSIETNNKSNTVKIKMDKITIKKHISTKSTNENCVGKSKQKDISTQRNNSSESDKISASENEQTDISIHKNIAIKSSKEFIGTNSQEEKLLSKSEGDEISIYQSKTVDFPNKGSLDNSEQNLTSRNEDTDSTEKNKVGKRKVNEMSKEDNNIDTESPDAVIKKIKLKSEELSNKDSQR